MQSADKDQQEMRAVAEKPHDAVVKFRARMMGKRKAEEEDMKPATIWGRQGNFGGVVGQKNIWKQLHIIA